MIIPLPPIRTDEAGFSALARLSEQLDAVASSSVQIDFSFCSWFDANMTAPLGGVIARAESRKNSVSFQNLSPAVRDILARNGFVQPRLLDRKGTTIPYQRFETRAPKLFAGYTDEHLRGKGMPRMSPGLRVAFLLALDELFQNASMHSETKFGVYCCGQFFPQSERLLFDLADMGIGFQANISKKTGVQLTPEDAIEWGLTGANTTRTLDVPGGLGLKLIREFVELNEGELIIISGQGYCSLTKGNLRKRSLATSFPGTVISLRINTADAKSYRLASEERNS
jgi:hypothetical protein